MSKKKNPYSCEDGIEKSVPRDNRLSSLGKPRDANRWSSGRIESYFLSHQVRLQGYRRIIIHQFPMWKKTPALAVTVNPRESKLKFSGQWKQWCWSDWFAVQNWNCSVTEKAMTPILKLIGSYHVSCPLPLPLYTTLRSFSAKYLVMWIVTFEGGHLMW